MTIEGSPKNGPWVALNLQSGLGDDEVTRSVDQCITEKLGPKNHRLKIF